MSTNSFLISSSYPQHLKISYLRKSSNYDLIYELVKTSVIMFTSNTTCINTIIFFIVYTKTLANILTFNYFIWYQSHALYSYLSFSIMSIVSSPNFFFQLLLPSINNPTGHYYLHQLLPFYVWNVPLWICG